MNNYIRNLGFIVFCIVAIFITGCDVDEPGNSLDWSDDGSVGLLSIDGALYLVDGQNGELAEIAKEKVQPLPGISKDGKLIVYSQAVECNDLSEGLKQLPAGQVKMIKDDAKKIQDEVLKAGVPIDGNSPALKKLLNSWSIRYLSENANSELLKIVKTEDIQKVKAQPLEFYKIVVVPKDNLIDKRIITSSIFKIMATRLSPDCSAVAYLMNQKDEAKTNALYVASLKSDVKAMHIDDTVAFSYDWRKDSKAIVYIKSDSADSGQSGLPFGSLVEKTIADANGTLLSALSEEPNGLRTHNCTGQSMSLAGLLFFPWLKAQYGSGERIFFSSANWSLPMSKMNEQANWSLFCYDNLTGTVTDILPSKVKSNVGDSLYVMQFAMSPDGTRVLLPITQNNFIIYELGKNSNKIVVKEQDSGNDKPELFPSWKGNNEITCIASIESKFLTEQDKTQFTSDDEVVILGSDGKFKLVLSRNWKDKIKEKANTTKK
jgi:hypothetical protein